MQKIYLKCFLHKNFGDDLLVSIFLNRFKNYSFVTYTKTNYDKKLSDNLILYSNFLLRIIDKIIRVQSNEKKSLEKYFIDKCKCSVVVGGSMFIENKIEKYNNFYFGKKNYSIIGSNFGPCISNGFFKKVENIVYNSDLTYFRDEKSYDLFKEINNVKLGNDLVFAIDKNKYSCNEKKQVFISVINCNEKIKNKENVQSDYVDEIIKIIEKMIIKKYKIILSSFCSLENDEKTILEIQKKLSEKNIDERIEIVKYDGVPDQIIKKIAESEYVIGSRFHACVLAIIFNKKLLPISYNNKTIDFLETIKFNGKIIDLNNDVDFSNYDLEKIKKFEIDNKFYQIVNDEFDLFEKIIEKYACR